MAIALRRKPAFPTMTLERLWAGYAPIDEFGNAIIEGASDSGKVLFLHSWKQEEIVTEQLEPSPSDPSLLKYLSDSPEQAVALGRRPLLVNVPSPAKYIIYLLITSQTGGRSEAEKHLRQAFELLHILRQLKSTAFASATLSLRSRHPSLSEIVEEAERIMKSLHLD
jgi:hypothetical protein